MFRHSNESTYCTPKIFAAIWLDDTYPIIQILDSNDLTSYISRRRLLLNSKIPRTSRVLFVILKVRFVTSLSKISLYLVRCYRIICHCPTECYKHKWNKGEFLFINRIRYLWIFVSILYLDIGRTHICRVGTFSFAGTIKQLSRLGFARYSSYCSRLRLVQYHVTSP